MSGYIYLASPYSHLNPDVRVKRFETACEVAGMLMKRGLVVFSPIAHSHSIEQFFDKIEPGEFWMKQDIPLLRHADKLMVLCIPGWKESKGVKQEIQFAQQAGIDIEYLHYEIIDVEDTLAA